MRVPEPVGLVPEMVSPRPAEAPSRSGPSLAALPRGGLAGPGQQSWDPAGPALVTAASPASRQVAAPEEAELHDWELHDWAAPRVEWALATLILTALTLLSPWL